MTVKELQEKSAKELHKLLSEQRTEAQNLYVDVTVKQEKSHAKYRAARKLIAQILTTLKQKETAEVSQDNPSTPQS